MSILTYSQRTIMQRAKEHPSYFMCSREDVSCLTAKAEKEARILLDEFKQYYTGDIGINIRPKEWALCTSIGAELTVNGKVCREYDDAETCFLELNSLILKRLLESGVVKKSLTA